jgi:predicted tellurium resistance membrane protein TerC
MAGVSHLTRGADSAALFMAGYLLEKALSVDNIFVFLLIFSYFSVAPEYQHRAGGARDACDLHPGRDHPDRAL